MLRMNYKHLLLAITLEVNADKMIIISDLMILYVFIIILNSEYSLVFLSRKTERILHFYHTKILTKMDIFYPYTIIY